MMRRKAIAMVVSIAAVLALGTRASADRPIECIKAARQAKRSCFASCVDTFQSEFVACFGGGGTGGGSGGGMSCAATCLTTRLSCEAGPNQATHACVSDTTNPQSCRSVLSAALHACRTDPNPSACSDQARLDALKCRQACIDAQAPAIVDCRTAFHACLRTCPSSPSGAFLNNDD
jgi:hypothetical protein